MCLVQPSNAKPYVLRFEEDSIAYEVMAHLVSDLYHVLTYIQLVDLMKSLKIKIEYYRYTSIYYRINQCNEYLSENCIVVKKPGIGLPNPLLPQSARTDEVEDRLKVSWEYYLVVHENDLIYTNKILLGDMLFLLFHRKNLYVLTGYENLSQGENSL